MRVLAIGLAVLGVCVFAWGLKYKLSLYDPPHAVTRHMPAAKLLTGKERRALPAAGSRPPAKDAGLAFLTTLVFSVLLLRHPRVFAGFASSLAPDARHPAPVPVCCAVSFIRPPPRSR